MKLDDGNDGANPNGAPEGPSADEEFDAAFDEAVGLGSDNPGQGADTDHGSAGADEPPAPAPAGATQPPAAQAPAQANPQDDPWANADPELRRLHEESLRDMQLRFDGARGRASGQERELTQLRQRIAELEARSGKPAGQAQGSNDDGQSGQSATSDDDDAAELARIREEYPELSQPLLKKIEKLEANLTRVQAPVLEIEQQRTQAVLEAQAQVLDQEHPGWLELIVSDRARFDGWLENQPRMYREAYARNAGEMGIVDGAEAALVIGKYKSDLGIAAPAPTPAPAPANPNPAQDRRARQIASARDVGRSAPPAATGIPEDDFDAAYDAFVAKKAAQQQ